MPKKAVSYIRFSTSEQAKGNSFRRQIEASESWCQRNGWILDTSHKLNDLGLSGFRGRNAKTGKLKAFLDGLESGRIKCDGLIIESLDRLSRDEVGDALRLFLNIMEHGVRIITTKPENVFDKKSINDPVNLIMAILEICRGFSESNMKSERVADAWKNKKEKARTGHKVSARCPGWLKLVGQEFIFVPEKVGAVRRVIDLANSGVGLHSICKIMNQEKQPTLTDRAKHWHASSVAKILNSRALMGEYQPRFSSKYQSEKHRTPDGAAIPDYYPALITEAEFYQLQGGLHSRRQAISFGQGRQSARVTNLFSRLLKDARTQATVYRVDKGKKSIPCLMSAEARAGIAGIAEKETFPYEDFENHFLQWFKEVSLDDLSNDRQVSEAKLQLDAVRGKIQETTKKLNTLKKRLTDEDEIDAVLDVIREVDTKLKSLKQEEEVLKAEAARSNPSANAQSLLSMMKKAKDNDLVELRSKLRFLINELIEVIYIRMQRDKKNRRWLYAQIHFRNGLIRKMTLVAYTVYAGGGSTNPVPSLVCNSTSTPQHVMKADLRDFKGRVGDVSPLPVTRRKK